MSGLFLVLFFLWVLPFCCPIVGAGVNTGDETGDMTLTGVFPPRGVPRGVSFAPVTVVRDRPWFQPFRPYPFPLPIDAGGSSLG